MESRLIQLVRERPIIYDKKHPGYKDSRGQRQNNWEEIWQILKAEGFDTIKDASEVKHLWDSLRDRYNAAKKRLAAATKSGAGANKSPTWKHWEEMSWLDDYCKRSSTVSNVSTISNVPTPSEPTTSHASGPEPTPSPLSGPSSEPSPSLYDRGETDSAEPSTSYTTSQSSRRRREANDPLTTQLVRVSNLLEQRMSAPVVDEAVNVGNMVAAQYRTLSAEGRIRYLAGISLAYTDAITPPAPQYEGNFVNL